MVKVDFNNISKSPIQKSFLEKIARETIARSGIFQTPSVLRTPACRQAGLPPWKGEDGYVISISFASVSEKEIQRLNKVYRKKNTPTDVLSFAEFGSQKEIRRAVKKNQESLFLGEIILCYNNVADYSKKNKIDLKRELSKVVAHGVLHLLGFRHGKKMFGMQEGNFNF